MKVIRFTAEELPEDISDKLHRHTFFASPGFADLWKSLGGRPIYWSVEEGGRIAAVMPSVEFGRKPLLRLQAMPDGCYASLVPTAPNVEMSEIAPLFLARLIQYGYARITIADWQNLFSPISGCTVHPCVTTLIDISDPDWKPPERNIGTEVRAAKRRGVEAVPFQRGRHLDSLLSLLETVQRGPQRMPKNPKKFFSALADLSEKDSRIRWLIIEHEKKVAASLVTIVQSQTALAWQGCFDRRYGSALKPNNFLFYETVSALRRDNIPYFNLGATPPGALGMELFKRKWGGEKYHYQTLVYRSGLGKLW